MHLDAERYGDHGASRIDGGSASIDNGGSAYVGDIDFADSAFPDRGVCRYERGSGDRSDPGGLPDGS